MLKSNHNIANQIDDMLRPEPVPAAPPIKEAPKEKLYIAVKGERQRKSLLGRVLFLGWTIIDLIVAAAVLYAIYFVAKQGGFEHPFLTWIGTHIELLFNAVTPFLGGK